MSHLKGLLARMRSIVGAQESESRMDEEFAFHVDMEAQRLVALHGVSLEEARRQALVAFGGRDTHREAMRDGRGARWFDDFGADVRYALRAMRRAPTFAIAVALTLGVGIGVNGIVFGSVNALLFRPLPARDPGQLVALFRFDTKSKQPDAMGYEDYADYRDKSGVFEDLAAMTGTPLNLAVPWASGAADMVWGEIVSENFFPLLGMQPALGRFFTTADGTPGTNALVVLSYDSWKNRFAGDSGVIGRVVRINGTGFTVLGVAPQRFRGMRTFGFWPEMWVPVGMHDVVMPNSRRLLQGRGGGWVWAFGRMRPGMDRARTEVAAARFASQLSQAFPASNATSSVIVIPAGGGYDNPSFAKPSVMFLASAMGMFASLVTLAIICANLANLQLARSAARAQEIAIRLSLGCSRGRLIRQMLVESLVLTIPGVMVAALILRLNPVINSWMLPRLQFRVGFDPSIDARVVLVTAATAVIAVLLFGLGPALRSSKARALWAVAGARQRSGGRPQRLRSALVVSQLGLSVVLLVGATLFVRSLMLARASDVGFDANGRTLMSVNIGLQGYDEPRGRRFYDDVLARVRAEPSVAAAAWAFPAPFDTYGRSIQLYIEGANTRSKDQTVWLDATYASEGFVDALGLRLQAGRELSKTDSAGAPLVMVVSREVANRFWPGKDPIGQRARRGGPQGPEITIVGVVADAKFLIVGGASKIRVYAPLRQSHRDWETLVVHTRGDPTAAIPRIRALLAAVDPALPVFGATTMDQSVGSGFSVPRTAAGISGFFGALALLISSVGLYAVVAAGVTERTREIGVRVALGSTPGEVMRFVMRGGAKLGLIGLVLGLGGAALVARLMEAILYGMSPADPVTFAIVPLTLALIVFIATYIPARRAVKLDPVAALRE